MNTTTVHGIPNCDTVRKARAWLDAQGVPSRFHDLRKQGVPAEALDRWIEALGWERLLNRQGTTWRRLDDGVKAGIVDAASARALMLEQASVIKRPVVAWPDGRFSVGFDAQAWADRL
ncbi:Spx/MgsR family transcriptional regulator [Sphaerotilus hippei]|uniref:Spx/MgsR family transcriptional regulator n=1 Tax=Sphaerotilus hippei TaxID=744406 RepID=A0A318H648_9BURK|nr:ArsC family reductase [Sphaerotilus hippei]PXW97918.1 Spx/MgsR family transcriptional regulator [Sphaerotilus hippei]